MSPRRTRVLELAVLGHLAEAPMHGYELRKRLNRELGAFHAFSYGSLYPCLKEMLRTGLIRQQHTDSARPTGRRSRIVYQLTHQGTERLNQLLADSAPAADDDECFGVHFTMFARTRSEVRLRILNGRRDRMSERLRHLHERVEHVVNQRGDPYTIELNRHHAEFVEREVVWLDELIQRERRCAGQEHPADGNIGTTVPPRQGAPPADRQP